MIFTTSEVLERLEAMPDKQLAKVINAAWEPFDAADAAWPSKVAPDRASFAALLRALTDEWPDKREPMDGLEMQRKAQGV
jgi:hypothetical protein